MPPLPSLPVDIAVVAYHDPATDTIRVQFLVDGVPAEEAAETVGHLRRMATAQLHLTPADDAIDRAALRLIASNDGATSLRAAFREAVQPLLDEVAAQAIRATAERAIAAAEGDLAEADFLDGAATPRDLVDDERSAMFAQHSANVAADCAEYCAEGDTLAPDPLPTGYYAERPQVVHAVRATEGGQRGAHQTVQEAGDWFVTRADGTIEVYSAALFAQRFPTYLGAFDRLG